MDGAKPRSYIHVIKLKRMKQQTAMQILFTNLESIDIKVPQGIKDVYLQMEKEQIIDAHYQGYRNDIGTTEVSEQYYNEIYGQD